MNANIAGADMPIGHRGSHNPANCQHAKPIVTHQPAGGIKGEIKTGHATDQTAHHINLTKQSMDVQIFGAKTRAELDGASNDDNTAGQKMQQGARGRGGVDHIDDEFLSQIREQDIGYGVEADAEGQKGHQVAG